MYTLKFVIFLWEKHTNAKILNHTGIKNVFKKVYIAEVRSRIFNENGENKSYIGIGGKSVYISIWITEHIGINDN